MGQFATRPSVLPAIPPRIGMTHSVFVEPRAFPNGTAVAAARVAGQSNHDARRGADGPLTLGRRSIEYE